MLARYPVASTVFCGLIKPERQTLNRLRVSMDRLGGLWSKFDAVSDSLAAAVARATDHGTLDLIAAELEGLRNTYLTGLNIAAMPARILVPLIPMIEAGVSRYKFMTERGTNGFEAMGVAAALQPLDAVGVVGVYEWLSGKEVVTGHDLSEGERALRGSLALLSATPVAASGTQALKQAFRGSRGAAVKASIRPPGKHIDADSVWNLGPVKRGDALHQNFGGKLPHGFPVIDDFANGTATSLKTMDFRSPALQSQAALERRLRGYIDKLASFQYGKYGYKEITPDMIKARKLVVQRPDLYLTDAQLKAIQNAARYGQSKGVQCVFQGVR